ncbi:uncharacterized protein LOC143852446 [Tasmannia lanceolata]|uniref:uncharacterized protein LOC143852446 n=1 Tax=Tasmannia lanceolata TaxID=3420 RepID=UPI004062892D
MKKILVDNGSSADILYYHAFEQMMIGADRLKPANSDLFGFSGEVVKVEGQIELPVLIGEPPCQSFAMVTFLVVKAKSAYNAILGRPGQNLLRAIPSAYHQKMKFITPGGVGEVRGDQPQSRQCYAAALRGKNASESLPIELYDLRDEAQITVNQPAEDLISIQLNIDDEQRVVQIGSALPEAAQQDLVQFLRANADVFAWTPSDMPGIDPSISTHELGVDQTCKPVKQKRRHFAPERRRAIREEVERLLKADFIREIQYPDWLANVVMVKKSNGKWRTCIDFTDLNKACPKDSYPLPKIDQLIDATAGHELLSFMDAFSGYNQIRMYESDIPKTSFVTDQGTYCYRVMPFGLKNAGATYQRLVNKLFRNQIGRNMEVYVDDMLVKSRSASNHVSDLEEAFQVLREHNMKLNPTKCTFGVGAGKFLGFMVSQRGIEANPEKIKAVMELTPPSTIREVQRLTGLVAALGRFISKSAERCLPFFNAIRGIKTAPWTPECQAAFEELKQYLSSPPLLSTPEPGEELILYLSAGPLAVAAVLVKEESNQQKPIYYVSKVLHDAETRYQRVEKLVCALITAARKLRPYFQAHTIKVLTGQPLRQILHRPDTSGRLVKWAVELSEFDIKYLPRPAIKAQILADFIAECTVPDPDPGLVAVPSPEAELAVPEPRVVSRASPPPGTEYVIAHPVFDEEPLWEVYVDGDLNKASPKDDFPLHHIDILVDNKEGHALLSFMDDFFAYNQIKMAPEDKTKTSFTTQWGTYYYRVMPFGLKNVVATYQRAATTLLHDLIHKDVEVYVDDMIIKAKTQVDNVQVLRRFFERISKYMLLRNLNKCVFGVTSGKLLGFLVSRRGIEVDPAKVKAIQEMQPPKIEKEIRGFFGKVQYLSRFITQLTSTCEPIFKLLKKNSPKQWNP